MESIVVEIADGSIDSMKYKILSELKLANRNFTYLSQTKKVLSPRPINPVIEFEVRMNYFKTSNSTKVYIRLIEKFINISIEERARNGVKRKGPLEGFHFGMSNMEAQLYAPSYSEEEINQERLGIEERKNAQLVTFDEFILELKTRYNIEVID